MFDEICMVCGKFLDSGLVYCSEVCESADRDYSSPSLSSTATSSVFTSPYISSAALAPLADVPPLMLTKRMSLGTSSSSASSDVNSVFEYDDDDNEEDQKQAFHLPPLDASDPDTIKVSNGVHRRPPMSYAFARRPSHADNRTLMPVLQRNSSSDTTPQKPPRPHKHSSDPHTHTLTHRASRSHDMRGSTPTPTHDPDTPKSKRSRTSLPAYFSHLQLSSHARDMRQAPAPSAVNLNDETAGAAPKGQRLSARVLGEQLLYEAARSLSGRLGADSRSASSSPGRIRVPVPASHDEREWTRQARSRVIGDTQDEERRGRSRVVAPRVKLLQS